VALTKVTGQVINDTTGLVVGVTTVGGGLSATDGFFSGIVTFSNSVSVAGTLTYEDVTNIDSVGLITARNGIVVGASPGVAASISVDGNMIVSGVTTFNGPDVLIGTGITLSPDGDATFTGIVTFTGADVLVGTAITLSQDGDASFTGIVTATKVVSSGDITAVNATVTSDLSIADKMVHTGDANTSVRFPAADTVSIETGGTQRFRVDSDGNVSVGDNPTVASDTLFHVEKSGETNIIFEGDTSTLGARLTLKNNNTGASAKNQIDFADAGGQSTSSIQGYNSDQSNNYGYLTFHTRSAAGTPPEERMRISKEGYITKPNLPAFMVNGSPSHSNFTGYDNSVHSFGNVHYNNGSHYNNSTGRFTAPVAGFYWFSAGIWSANSDEASGTYLLVLTRNDSDASNELQFAGCNHRYEKVQLTVSAGVNMTAGQTVRLWHNGSRISSTPRNFFSGYLVG
jgi:hypothetical protein